MALSNELLAYIDELGKIDKWEKLPKTDPRIVKLQELSRQCEHGQKKLGNHKKVVVMREGKFVQAYNSAAEAAEALGMSAVSVQKISRGERKPPEGYEIEYIENEVY